MDDLSLGYLAHVDGFLAAIEGQVHMQFFLDLEFEVGMTS